MNSNCCNAPFMAPGWPDSDVCSDCKEHCGEIENEKKKDELLELAWGLIANANEGNWDDVKQDWRIAAEKWRDKYHESLPKGEKEKPRDMFPDPDKKRSITTNMDNLPGGPDGKKSGT